MRHDRFPAASHEAALDRAMLIGQEMEPATYLAASHLGWPRRLRLRLLYWSRRLRGHQRFGPISVKCVRPDASLAIDHLFDQRSELRVPLHIGQGDERHPRQRRQLQPDRPAKGALIVHLETFDGVETKRHIYEVAAAKLVAVKAHLSGAEVATFKQRHDVRHLLGVVGISALTILYLRSRVDAASPAPSGQGA